MPLSLSFLRSAPSAIVTVILVAQAAAFYSAPTAEHIPNPPPLKSFPANTGAWTLQHESDLESEVQNLLKADDTLNRVYTAPDGLVTLFVGYFRSQRGGVTPHSPKICLPGNGWTPEGSRTISIAIPGAAKPTPVNRYTVRKGEDHRVVLYWYSTAHHEIADEYVSKLYLMDEGLRYRRSDEAVFRVIVPIGPDGEDRADAKAIRFIQEIYPPLKRQIWSD